MPKYFYNVPEVSAITGIPAQKIRINMQKCNWDLGSITESETGTFDYIITPYKLWKCLGICIDGYTPPAEQIKELEELIKTIKENTEVANWLFEALGEAAGTLHQNQKKYNGG